jgi:AcrR family transcriptional regulator
MSIIEEKKSEILAIASQLLKKDGKLSIADLAARVGVSRVTLYRYFGSRDALLIEVEKKWGFNADSLRRDNLEKRILKAAEELFFEKGLFHVSLEEIADKAKVGIATLYRKFESRDGLIEEFLASQISEIGEIVIDESRQPEEELESIAEQFLNIMQSGMSFFFQALLEHQKNPDFFSRIKKGQYRTLYRISDYMKKYIDNGFFKDVNQEDLAASFLGQIISFGLIMPKLYNKKNENNKVTAKFIVKQFLEGALK